MCLPVIALRAHRVVAETPRLDDIGIHIQTFQLSAGARGDAIVGSAVGGIVGLIGNMGDVAEEGDCFDCCGVQLGEGSRWVGEMGIFFFLGALL